MWHLDLKKLTHLVGDLGKIAVETGTGRGNGTRALAKHFSRVVSVELSAELHQEAKRKLAGADFAHVTLLHGDSGEALPRILRSLPPEETLFLFLDAHWSGDASVDWAHAEWKGYGVDTAHRGALGALPSSREQCPLAEELRAIVEHWPGEAFVLIDDTKNIPVHGPGLRNGTFPGEDWSHLSRESLLAIVEARLEGFYELSAPAQWLLKLRSR